MKRVKPVSAEFMQLLRRTDTCTVSNAHLVWQRAVLALGTWPVMYRIVRPCVLLASGVVDDNLKGEVLRHRGYDVLPESRANRPLMEAETQRGKS